MTAEPRRMGARVDRQKLFAAMADPDPENQYLVDVRTGGVIRLSLKDPAGIERFKKDLAADPKRYLQVPKPSGRERYRDLEDYIAQLQDPHLKKELQRALAGPNPFRELNQALERRFTEKRKWDEFRRQRVERRVADFLKTSSLS